MIDLISKSSRYSNSFWRMPASGLSTSKSVRHSPRLSFFRLTQCCNSVPNQRTKSFKSLTSHPLSQTSQPQPISSTSTGRTSIPTFPSSIDPLSNDNGDMDSRIPRRLLLRRRVGGGRFRLSCCLLCMRWRRGMIRCRWSEGRSGSRKRPKF